MTAYNAMLNIASTAVSVSETTEETTTEPSTTETEPTAEPEDPTSETFDDYIDYEVISETVDTSQPFMSNSSTYDSGHNYVVQEQDEASHQVQYEYDSEGNITSYTNGNNKETEYEYDAAGNVTKIKMLNAQNQYSYNSAGYISEIQHNNFSYIFNYDVFNRLISSKIGNTALSSNSYTNGNLTQTTYANGQHIEYSYDDYNNIIELCDGESAFARFVYDKKGRTTVVEDIIDSDHTNFYYYYYDFNGNKTGEYRTTNNGILSYYVGYASNGDTIEKTLVNGQIKTITKGTDENGSFVSMDGIKVKSDYDDFGRTTKVTTSNSDSNVNLETSYTYKNGAETNSTTKLVESLKQQLNGTTTVQYTYDYDNNNNITAINEVDPNNNTFQIAEYSYNDYNQLESETDYTIGTYMYYHYDNAGNITGIDKYGYNTQTHSTTNLISQKTYSYDGTWKDKLTSFNSGAISYDNSGNPLTYRNGMSFNWIRGRVLDKIISSIFKTSTNPVFIGVFPFVKLLKTARILMGMTHI